MAGRWYGIPCLTLALVLFFGPEQVHSKSKPDWVDGPSRLYPQDKYLTGVGSDANRKKAEESAYAAIARIFHADVRSRMQDSEQYRQESRGQDFQSKQNIEIYQTTSVVTRKILEGVRIAEVWVDRSNATYALAVLDRGPTLSLLHAKILEMDREILDRRIRVEANPDPLDAVGNLYQASEIAMDREEANSDLRIVNPIGLGLEPPTPLSRLRQEIQELLSTRLLSGVLAEGPHPELIQSSLAEGLRQEGFNVTTGSDVEHLDLWVKSKLVLERSEAPPWKYVRWRILVDCLSPTRGKIIGSFERSGREGDLGFHEAELKAVRAAANILTLEIGRFVLTSLAATSGGKGEKQTP